VAVVTKVTVRIAPNFEGNVFHPDGVTLLHHCRV
jgi:hypothetical protein